MKTYQMAELTESDLIRLCTRPSVKDDPETAASVRAIVEDVRRTGQDAVWKYARQFDGHDRILSVREEWTPWIDRLTPAQRSAIDDAMENIRRFHTMPKREPAVEVRPGVHCWREWRPIQRVGLYVPGGSAPLVSTLMMLGVPARVAGCEEIVVCTPPDAQGNLAPAIAYVSERLQLDRVFLLGGVQAIAAMAFGTELIPAVDKIFGPGNRFVTQAKLSVQSHVAIDLPAGPSEILIVADESARPEFIAADMLAQAEHGADSPCVLVTTDSQLIPLVENAIGEQQSDLSRRDTCARALANSLCVVARTLDEAIRFANAYAPEHLSLMISDPMAWTPRIVHAGSVFCGSFAPVAAGDYASGTNHTLPTGRWARAYSGVHTTAFLKSVSFQSLSREGLMNMTTAAETLAEIEALDAHRNSLVIRRRA